MRIACIELFHVSVPLPETFWPSWIPGYPQTHNRFTLAKLTTEDGIEGYAAGQSMGTPHYISPEQAKGEKQIDGRTDIFITTG